MLQGFYPFGDDLAVEVGGQLDHALDDAQIVGVYQHVAHKALIDLQGIHRQLAQVGQRGVAGAEIIQRKAHALMAAGAHDGTGLLHVGDGGAFQHLQLQPIGRQVRIARQLLAEELGKAGRQQVVGADIDTDVHIQPLFMPQL